MANPYQTWLEHVENALSSINMSMRDWQKNFFFDFESEHRAGTDPHAAAEKANRFWWRAQNKALNQECRKSPDCWLPGGHQEDCQPVTQ